VGEKIVIFWLIYLFLMEERKRAHGFSFVENPGKLKFLPK
jgi:hypothetical protein